MPEKAVLTPLKCAKDTFREKEVSSFLSPKEKEGMSFPKGTSLEGQRALKAFYQHRPSAPANFKFFVSKPEETDLQMQSADSIFDDLVEEDDLSPVSPIEPVHKPLPMSQSACYQIQEEVPMDVQLSLNSWIPPMRNVEEHQRLRWSRARPMSFHLAENASRRVSLSVDWTDIVSRLVTEPEECTSNCNTSKPKSAEYLKPCSVNSSKHVHCKPKTNRRQSDGSANESPCPVLPSVLRFEDLDSDFLETTDDEDNIFHAPYALSCVGSMIYDAPNSRQSITTSTTTSLTKGFISSNGRFLQTPCHPDHPLRKKPEVSRFAFLRRLASKLCRSPLVKDE